MIAVVALVVAAGAVHAADDNAAVLPLELVGNIPAGRTALEAAAARGLALGGVRDVVHGPKVGTALTTAGARVACTDAPCWVAAGKALGARYLVAGVVERKGGAYEAEFRLIEAESGRQLHSQRNTCDVGDCSVAELCRLSVLELVRGGMPRPSPAAAAPPAKPPEAPPILESGAKPGEPPLDPAPGAPVPGALSPAEDKPAAPSVPLAPVAPPEVQASSGRRLPGWLPWVAIGGGLVAGAVGGYLLAVDGDCIDTAAPGQPCKNLHDNRWPGVLTAGGGAVLVATGVVLAIVDRPTERAAAPKIQVGLGPHGASLLYAGRF